MHESRYAGGLLVVRDQEQVCSFLREPWICAVCGLLVSDRWHHTFTSEMRVNMEFGQMEKGPNQKWVDNAEKQSYQQKSNRSR